MENKNRYKLQFIIKYEDGESIILTDKQGRTYIWKYIEGPDDPKFDDRPSEQLEIGAEYDLTFTRVTPDPVPEFGK